MAKKSTASKSPQHARKVAAATLDALDELLSEVDEAVGNGEERIDLVEIIEAERITLLEAHSLMKCLQAALLNSDLDEGLFYADLANVAARIVDESVARLDDTRIKPMIEALKGSASLPAALHRRAPSVGKFQVKDGETAYLC